jgi:NADPH:quinone reductase-like Zn-dependent oxidoreductase
MAGGGTARILQAMSLGLFLSRIGNKKIRFFIAKINGTDLRLLKDLIEAGKIVPVIDRRYPLSEVAEALRYREEGHAQGKVVITIHLGKDVQQG